MQDNYAKKMNNINGLETIKRKIGIDSNQELISILLGVLKEGNEECLKVETVGKIKYFHNAILALDQLLDVTYVVDSKKLENDLYRIAKCTESKINKIRNNKVEKFMQVELESLLDVISKDRNAVYDENDLKNAIKILLLTSNNINDVRVLFAKNPLLYKIELFKQKGFLFKLLDEYIKSIYTMNIDKISYYEKLLNFILNGKGFNISNEIKEELINKLIASKDVINDLEKFDKDGKLHYLDKGINLLQRKKEAFISSFNYSKNKNLLLEIDKLKTSEYGLVLDLRDKFIFTIDTKGAVSLEDALSFEKLPNGNYLLGVYITDVNAYVKEGSLIDKRAYNMGETIYVADNHITMLDDSICNDLCSLNKNCDRYAYAHLFELDSEYNLVNSRVANSIINVSSKYTFEDVDRIIKKVQCTEEYFTLLSLKEASSSLNKEQRAMLKYHEAKEKLDPARKNMPLYQSNIGSAIIDDIKVFTNNYIAKYFYDSGLPFIYRNNCRNDNTKLIRILEDASNNNPKVIEIISSISRDYSASTYSHINCGHYGLGKDCYAHATTPLRKYASMFNQRLIQRLMIEKNMTDKEIYRYETMVALVASHLNEQLDLNDEYMNHFNR